MIAKKVGIDIVILFFLIALMMIAFIGVFREIRRISNQIAEIQWECRITPKLK